MTMWINMLNRMTYQDEASADGASSGGATPSGEATEGTTNTDPSSDGDAGEGDTGTEAGGDAGEGEGDSGDNGDAKNGELGTYADFEAPEGMTINQEMIDAFTPEFQKLKLSQEQAQGLVDIQAQQVQAQQQAQVDEFSQQLSDWQNQSQNDEEFGGDKFDESIAVAHEALEAFGTPELKNLMDDYGVGNHPEMIRFMVRVGQAIKEDSPGGGKRVETSKDRTSILYPDN